MTVFCKGFMFVHDLAVNFLAITGPDKLACIGLDHAVSGLKSVLSLNEQRSIPFPKA